MKLDHFLLVRKINSKSFKGKNVRPKPVKVLEENRRRTFQDIGICKDFLYKTQRAHETKQK
jgi:hypothetical protein